MVNGGAFVIEIDIVRPSVVGVVYMHVRASDIHQW